MLLDIMKSAVEVLLILLEKVEKKVYNSQKKHNSQESISGVVSFQLRRALLAAVTFKLNLCSLVRTEESRWAFNHGRWVGTKISRGAIDHCVLTLRAENPSIDVTDFINVFGCLPNTRAIRHSILAADET